MSESLVQGTHWHQHSSQQVLDQLSTSAEGLRAEEASHRLTSDDEKILKRSQHISALQILIAQFNSLMIWNLLAAGLLAGALGQ